MPDPTILLNGNYIPWRPFNDEEQAKLDVNRQAGKRMSAYLRETGKISPDDPEWCEACFDVDVGLCDVHNGKKQFHAFLLVTPVGGDDLTYTDLPEGYDELRVRWKGKDNAFYNMRIDRA